MLSLVELVNIVGALVAIAIVAGAIVLFKKSETIRTKLIVSFLGIGLVPVAVLAVVNFEIAYNNIMSELSTSLVNAAKVTATRLDELVAFYSRAVTKEAQLPTLVAFLASKPEKRTGGQEEAMAALAMRSLGQRDPEGGLSYALYDITGNKVLDTSNQVEDVDPNKIPYFSFPFSTGKSYVSPVVFLPRLNRPTIYFSAPVVSQDDTPLGVLVMRCNADVLQRIVHWADGLAGSESFGILYDENLIRLAHGTSPELLYKLVTPLPLSKLRGMRVARRFPDNLDDSALSTSLPELAKGLRKADAHQPFVADLAANGPAASLVVFSMQTRPWVVAFARPHKVALGLVRSQAEMALLFTCLIALVASLFAFLIARQVAAPISEVSFAAREAAKGNLELKVKTNSHDEIGVLARAFNYMTGRLRESMEDLRFREEKYRGLYEDALEGFFQTSVDGKPISINKAMARIFGYSSIEEMMSSITDIANQVYANSDDRGHFLEKLFEQGVIFGDEMEFVRKNGEKFWASLSGRLVRDDGGKPLYIDGIVSDISDRKRVERELLRVQKLESVGVLAGGIAHDFNNLLTAILGNISLARGEVAKNDKTTRLLFAAETATLRARNLTNQLLTFSKGGIPVRKSIRLNDVLRDSTTFSLSGSSVVCEFLIPEDTWPVYADEGQISQVISNVVINAAQAMSGGGNMKLTCENVIIGESSDEPLASGKYVKVVVEDRGEGIDQEDLGKIFDPYYTTKEHGRGLGLATVYSIIRNHQGHISVESTKGVGTTVAFYLPISEEAVVLESEVENAIAQRKGRILVMDDDEMVRDVAGEMLRQSGYEVAFAVEGGQAIKMYADAMKSGKFYDAILMDLTIPGGIGGKEAMKKLLEIDPNVKAIVSSGYSNDPIMSNYKDFGFAGVVPKPYRMNDLAEKLREVLG